jgi:hypothetical protein
MSDFNVFRENFESHEEYVEEWYQYIKDLTFQSWIIPFEKTEAEMLIQMCRSVMFDNQPAKDIFSSFLQFKSKISVQFDSIKTEVGPESGFFIRLGRQSVKDAVLTSKLAQQRFLSLLYREYEKEFQIHNFRSKEEKAAWICQKSQMSDFQIIEKCNFKSWKCSNIDEMFDILLSSERILTDLIREVRKKDPRFYIVIRKWNDQVQNHLEFRGFVFNHHLVALSQYDDQAFFEDIAVNKDKIRSEVIKVHETKVLTSLPKSLFELGKYTIDFAIIFHPNDIEVIVIEINQFSTIAGLALFNWNHDLDVLTGKKEFEFRIVNEHDYDEVDYEAVIDPDVLNIIKQTKKQIINNNTSFLQRWFSWIG